MSVNKLEIERLKAEIKISEPASEQSSFEHKAKASDDERDGEHISDRNSDIRKSKDTLNTRSSRYRSKRNTRNYQASKDESLESIGTHKFKQEEDEENDIKESSYNKIQLSR